MISWNLLRTAQIGLFCCIFIFTQAAGQRKPEHMAVTRVSIASGMDLLAVPDICSYTSCPLLMVSHPFKGRPQDGLDETGHPVYAHFIGQFLEAGYAVLLSSDGGEETWGNTTALDHLVSVSAEATRCFSYNGRTFTLGVSMGALPATLVGLTGRLPVRATALVGGVLSLPSLYQSGVTFRDSMARAYGLSGSRLSADQFGFATVQNSPLEGTSYFAHQAIPFLAVGSSSDAWVLASQHSEPFIESQKALGTASRFLEVTGPHLSASHFSDQVAREIIQFFANHSE